MGLTFVLETVYLLPLTIFFLGVSVGALGFRAKRRQGYGPFAVGILAGILLLLGKFVVESELAVYSSVALLIAASVWNSWPLRSAKSVLSAPTKTPLRLGSMKKET
jgi:mercuric ion transport protein